MKSIIYLSAFILIASLLGCNINPPTTPIENNKVNNNKINLTVQDVNFGWIVAPSNFAPPQDMPFGFFVDGQGDMGVQFVDVDC